MSIFILNIEELLELLQPKSSLENALAIKPGGISLTTRHCNIASMHSTVTQKTEVFNFEIIWCILHHKNKNSVKETSSVAVIPVGSLKTVWNGGQTGEHSTQEGHRDPTGPQKSVSPPGSSTCSEWTSGQSWDWTQARVIPYFILYLFYFIDRCIKSYLSMNYETISWLLSNFSVWRLWREWKISGILLGVSLKHFPHG